jgi:tetratricopeptide (TPR) repeat protein
MELSPRPRASKSAALALVLTTAFVACGQPERRVEVVNAEGLEVTRSTHPSAAATAKRMTQELPLPPPTMTPPQVRQAMWDILARQRRGDTAKVLAEYASQLAANKSLELRFLAAMAILDEDESWRALHAIADDYPKFAWAHAGMGAIYARWKIRDQCEREIGLVMDYGADILWSYTIRGDLYRRIGEFALAQRDYVVALRGDPTDADARVGLALSKRALGQTDRLREELEQALRDVPTHYEAAVTLAPLLDDANDPAAVTAWDRVGELDPKNRVAQLALARLRADTDPAGAAAAYEKASKTGPLTKTEQETLAKLYRKLNRPDDEIRSLQIIVRLDAKDLAPVRRMAEVYASKNDWEDAEKTLQGVINVIPNDPDALMGLGRASERRQDFRRAIEFYRQAVAAGSDAAKAARDRVSADCLLPSKPLSGADYNEYYANVMESLQRMYAKRLQDAPRLKGKIKLRVETNTKGRILALDISEDTMHDPWLAAHLYFAVLDSKFPHYATPKFVIPFNMEPPARK